jgi:hypothetical protein
MIIMLVPRSSVPLLPVCSESGERDKESGGRGKESSEAGLLLAYY